MEKNQNGRRRREDGNAPEKRYSRDNGPRKEYNTGDRHPDNRPARKDNSDRPHSDNRGNSSSYSRERREYTPSREGGRYDGGNNRDNNESRPYNSQSGDRNYRSRDDNHDRPARPNRENGDRPSYDRQGGERSYRSRDNNSDRPVRDNRESRPYNSQSGDRNYRSRDDNRDRPARPNRENGERPSYDRQSGERNYRSRDDNRDRPARPNRENGDRPSYDRQSGDRNYRSRDNNSDRPDRDNRESRPYNSQSGERNYRSRDENRDRPARPNRENGDRPSYDRQSGDRNYRSRDNNSDRPDRDNRERRSYNTQGGDRENRTYNRTPQRDNTDSREHYSGNSDRGEDNLSDEQIQEMRQKHYSKKKQLEHRIKNESEDTELRLNRYISMGGVCSRRDADVLITSGRVKVNGEIVQIVGIKVKKTDNVQVDDNRIAPEKKIYIALNKPKDFVTTVDDPLERKTVMSLIEGACKERVYPVGRLDRMTTGVLLFTNDGDMAKKLTHPKYNHKKIYHVFLDKAISETDMKAILDGVELEDGSINADDVRYASDNKAEVGIEIHSGKNRIVRRIFEHLGYQIEKLDRVYFAGITKKNLPRGKWRFLTPDEIQMLKCY